MAPLRRMLRPSRVVATLAVVAAFAAVVLWLVPSNYYLLLPAPATPVAPLVTVEGEKPERGGGGIYFVAVVERRASLLERLFPGLREGATLIPAQRINPPGVSEAARRRGDLRQMTRSQSVAAAVALRAAGYDVVARPIGVLVTDVFAGAPAVGTLEPTDVIVAVDGRRVRTPAQLRRAIAARRPGATVRLTVRRGKERLRVTVRTVADPRDPQRPIIGVLVDQAADIDLPVEVKINAGAIGGPSAGLAFALDIVDELGRDIDRGYKVAVTGALELDGTVIPIGGVKQKVLGARDADVDIFLAPAGQNAEEARKHAGDLRVIAVQTFPQALRALATLPPKA